VAGVSCCTDSPAPTPFGTRWRTPCARPGSATSSARLGEGVAAFTNLHIPSRGHLTICRDPDLIARVVQELLGSERYVADAVV